jgi:hypothetical protein
MRIKLILGVFVVFCLSFSLVSAIDLDISAKPISNIAIQDLNEPAVFELTIRNLGKTDNFEIYSLVGIDIFPEESFVITSGATKKLEIQAIPQTTKPEGFFTFEYTIRNSLNEIQKESLTINIVELGGAFSIIPENINPKSEQIEISIENKANLKFEGIEIVMNSAFFDYETTLSLNPEETKKLEIPIDSEKSKKLDSGDYLLNTRLKIRGETGEVESIIKFLAQEDIETIETREGSIIRRNEIVKRNLGNIRKTVEISAEKNLISYLFTTLNVQPTDSKINGFKIQYFWEKELIPGEEFKVVVKTNWFYPLIVILLAIGLFILIKRSVERDLILRKNVSFIKTKGGQFALKVSLRIKAKRFIERINVIDKLPPLVHLYERYGAITPDKIDLDNRRIEWNVPSLNKDEERLFTYIIYSKVGVIGKFELPSARGVYEKEGKVKETTSNRSFFINEPKK